MRSDSRGTSSATKLCQAGMPSPVTTPLTPMRATMTPGRICPPRTDSHRAKAITIAAAWLQMRSVRREWRSASEPPRGLTTMAGANWAKAPRPTQAAEPVASWRRNGTVTFCIHIPMLDTNAPAQNRAKSRWCNARKACRTPRPLVVMRPRTITPMLFAPDSALMTGSEKYWG